MDTPLRIHHYDTRAEGEAAVRDGDIDVLVVDARRLEWRTHADEPVKAVVTGAIQLVAARDRAEAAGMEPDELLAVVEPVPVTNTELGRVEARSPDDETAAFVMTMVLFFAISTYGAMVLSGVVERSPAARSRFCSPACRPGACWPARSPVSVFSGWPRSRTAHRGARRRFIADSSTSPPSAAKSWRGRSCGSCWATPSTPRCSAPWDHSRPDPEDASSVTGPVSIILVLGFMVSFAAIGSADTTWAHLVSWFPLTTPLAMPNRIATGAATWWGSTGRCPCSPSRPSPGSSSSAAASTPGRSSTPVRPSRSLRHGEGMECGHELVRDT